ncbi:hypothetical protein BL253_37490 [Pseudofrankia asymbiotica]|uniref:HTH luxR-type domain-containing protein n=1 Tax=Pseudofrankia asymbiotica TaxID=1834516 RepID=A0A1V2HZN6_9ACTN|nr:helix-turn-helix transcriptional regulator [Pseudofrankia asymbiotica]ONH21880.1 hypothetical protein BL253_37490 [Pseudofrankia asymbiotica]
MGGVGCRSGCHRADRDIGVDPADVPEATLTARERQVVRMVATGLSNPEIAERLVLSASTVRTHPNRTMTKLALSSRAQVVVYAYETGLVVPSRYSVGPGAAPD